MFFQPPNNFFQENYQNYKFYRRIRRVDEINENSSQGVERGKEIFQPLKKIFEDCFFIKQNILLIK